MKEKEKQKEGNPTNHELKHQFLALQRKPSVDNPSHSGALLLPFLQRDFNLSPKAFDKPLTQDSHGCSSELPYKTYPLGYFLQRTTADTMSYYPHPVLQVLQPRCCDCLSPWNLVFLSLNITTVDTALLARSRCA